MQRVKLSRGIVAIIIMLSISVLISGYFDNATAKTTIRFWTFLNPETPDPRSRALKSVLETFMAENPNIEVKVEPIHWGKIDGLAIQATAAGQGPDVLNVYSVQLTKHVKAGTVTPLDEYISKWYPKNKEDYLIRLKDMEFDGHVVALPWETRGFVLYYRKDLLEKAGLSLPKTLDELGIAAQKVTTDRVMGFVVGLSETMLAAAAVETFEQLLWAGGGELVGSKGKAAFNSEAGIRVAQWIYDLVYKYKGMSTTVVATNADDITSGFKAGTIAMTIAGSMRVPTVRAAKDIGWNLRTTVVPSWEPLKPAPCLAAGQTLTIGANSKNRDDAWKFIEHYLGPKSQVAFVKALALPVRKSVYGDPWFLETPEGKEMVTWKDYIDKHGRFGRYPEDFAKLSELVARALQDVLLKRASIKEALDDAARKYDAQAGL